MYLIGVDSYKNATSLPSKSGFILFFNLGPNASAPIFNPYSRLKFYLIRIILLLDYFFDKSNFNNHDVKEKTTIE